MIELIFSLYLLLIIFVGIFSNKFIANKLDFLLAGRKLGPWVTAFSERASGESAWLLLGLPGAAIAIGYGEIWAVLGITIGIISSWFLVAEKLRDETEKYNAVTIPDYLEKKFNDDGTIKLISAGIITLFFSFYVSAQFHGAGKILEQIFGIDPIYGITLSAIIIIIYTLLGGLLAVAWTDLIQGFLMIGTLVILPALGFLYLFESGTSFENILFASSDPIKNSIFSSSDSFSSMTLLALGGMSWGLGYLGQPHLLIRYMAIKSVKDVKIAKWIATFWAIPGILGAFLIGIVGLAYFGEDYFIGKDPEIVMPLLASTLLPSWLAGLLISGAVAAMMSTADSQLLVSSSTISEDLGLSRLFKKRSTEIDLLKNTRLITTILGVIAYSMAIYSQITGNSIFGIVSFAWSGLGSSFGPAIILSLWWNKTSTKGVIAGLLSGSISTIIWGSNSFLKSIVTERLSSFIIAFLAIVIFSYIYKDE